MRGPKPSKIYDTEKLKSAIERGVKHGAYLYQMGCRCELCRASKRDAAKVYRDSYKKDLS